MSSGRILESRHAGRTIVFGVALLPCIGSPESDAQTVFVDRSNEWNLVDHHPQGGMGTGVAAADYDRDGYVDLFVPQREGTPDRLYHNQRGGGFREVAAEVGLANERSSRTALWLDYDGDGFLDLLVANDDLDAVSSFTLFRQGSDGSFADVTVAAGVSKPPVIEVPTHHWGGLCAGDLNNDGFLDVFSGQWRGPGHLLRNDTRGGFLDVSAASGVDVSLHAHQCTMLDVDGDGWLDIYVAIDFAPNLLWHNQRDGTFVDVAADLGLDNDMNDMGIALGDYDNDDDLDIYVTNIYYGPGDSRGPKRSVLLRNDSTTNSIMFSEVSESLGVDNGGFGWGATFLDVNNDGFLDLAATNGWRSGSPDKSRLFMNVDGGRSPFVDVSEQAGFDDEHWGSALVAVDVDRDGDLDLIQACMDGYLRLLMNEPSAPQGNWLAVKPRMRGGNEFAIGATVTLLADGRRLSRYITAGTSYMGQEPALAFFGIGETSIVESVEVRWPDGRLTSQGPVSANREITILRVGPDPR